MVTRDEQFASRVGSFYGEYIGTFKSVNEQVRADMFKVKGGVIAHVSYGAGLKLWTITDPYIVALKKYAEEQGFADRFRIVHAA